MNPFLWQPNDRRWLLPFAVFCALVVGSLLYLHLADAEKVEKPLAWGREHGLYVCEAPDFVVKTAGVAVAFVRPWVSYSTVVIRGEGTSCASLGVSRCTFEGGQRPVPCVQNGVLITTADSQFDFGTPDEGGHGDETLILATDAGIIHTATVLFPSSLELIKKIEYNEEGDVVTTFWPAEVELFAVVHGMLHAEGYGHVYTQLLGMWTATPTGHVMSPDMAKLGPDTTGL